MTLQADASGANLHIVNSGSNPAVIKTLTIKGTKITDSGFLEASSVDLGSAASYGRRTMRINLPSIDNLEDAQYIADFECHRRKAPAGEVATLTLLSHATQGGSQHPQQLARTLGDLIAIQETQTGHNKNYFIVGEAHQLSNAGALFKTTWFLELAPDTFPWQLGVTSRSNLGSSTVLTY